MTFMNYTPTRTAIIAYSGMDVTADSSSIVIALRGSKVTAKAGSRVYAEAGSTIVAESGSWILAESGATVIYISAVRGLTGEHRVDNTAAHQQVATAREQAANKH